MVSLPPIQEDRDQEAVNQIDNAHNHQKYRFQSVNILENYDEQSDWGGQSGQSERVQKVCFLNCKHEVCLFDSIYVKARVVAKLDTGDRTLEESAWG